MPPAGTHTHIIHQYAPLLQFEPKLTLRGLGAGKDVSSCCGERREQTTIWTACLCVLNAVHAAPASHAPTHAPCRTWYACSNAVAKSPSAGAGVMTGTSVPSYRRFRNLWQLTCCALKPCRRGEGRDGRGRERRGEERRDNAELKSKSARVERRTNASMPAEMCTT